MERTRRAAVVLLAVAVAAGACSYEAEVAQPISTVRAQTSWVLAADGSVITALHAEEDREDVPLEALPAHVVDAVVAIEDQRFYSHGGVDLRAVVRAALRNVEEGGVAQGGSTITQQYVKNVLLGPDRTLKRKLREAALAWQLEDRYTKERILGLYLNTIYFGNGAYGVEAAAREYFGVNAADLTLAQGALLAGLIRAPSTSDPYQAPDAALARRNVVLDQMVELGYASAEDAAAAAAEPLGLAERAEEDRYPAAHFVEQVKRFVLDDPRFGDTREEREALLFTGGLRIETTLDVDAQRAAEAAVARVLSEPERDPEAAMVAVEPDTGHVKALVGGRDFFGSAGHAKFDLATQKGRPAGSSFKPLVLAAAIEKGFPLDKPYAAPAALTLPTATGPWRVENYGGQAGGQADLVEATVRSYNTVYAQLMAEVGPADAVAFAHRVGITSPLSPYPSTVLGVNDVTPLEMATAYATFANRGLLVSPVFVTKITRPDGTIVWEHERRTERAVAEDVADRLTSVLTQVIERGTGTKARIGRPAAGKTGTGQDWTDAWFVGFTPALSTAVWVGYPEGQVSMVPPRTRVRVTGGSWPAEIWQLFMTAALATVPAEPFPEPVAPLPVEVPAKRVPDVTGFPVDEAIALLGRAGWEVERHDVPSSEFPPGTVVAQSPGGAELAPAGSTIIIDVANGRPEIVAVPSLLGLTEAEAAARARQAGLRIDVRRQQEPPSPGSAQRAGRVWKQRPAAGTLREAGSTVIVWLNPPGGPAAATAG